MTQPERTELASPQGAPVALGAGGSTDKALDPAADKALLCDRISAVLGVRICRLVKFAGKQPTFRMELEQTKAEFRGVRKLMSQSAVREEIAASTGKIIPKFKGKDWDQLAQAMLDACVIEQGGEKNERESLARMYVVHYLAGTGFLDTLEGQPVQNLRKPIVLCGKVAICASDLQVFVNKTMLQSDPKKARRLYAENYVRKLINLEVKLPPLTEQRVEALLLSRPHADRDPFAPIKEFWKRWNVLLAFLPLIVVIAMASSLIDRPLEQATPANQLYLPIKEEPPSQIIGVQTKSPLALNRGVPDPKRGDPTKTLIEPPAPLGAIWYGAPLIALLILVGFLLWAITHRDDRVHDSPSFARALQRWSPALARACPNPREIRRFQNRLRYLAMRWAPPEPKFSTLERWLRQWRFGLAAVPRSASPKLEESALVALAARDFVASYGGPPIKIDVPQKIEEHYREILGELGDTLT